MSYTIEREDPQRDLKALRAVLNNYSNSSSVFVPVLQDLADSIEEQVKPAIAEPTETFSVVRAKCENGDPGLFWVRLPSGFWTSDAPEEYGVTSTPWRMLHVSEVLRAGIGEPSDEEQAAAKYETTVALADAYSRGYHEGFESNIPSPVDRSNINSALREEIIKIGLREGRLIGEGHSYELADAVMKVLAQPTDEWRRLDVANAQTEAYTKGAEDFATKVRREICALRAKVVTGPEKRTCDDLLALVGVLQGLS